MRKLNGLSINNYVMIYDHEVFTGVFKKSGSRFLQFCRRVDNLRSRVLILHSVYNLFIPLRELVLYRVRNFPAKFNFTATILSIPYINLSNLIKSCVMIQSHLQNA